MAEQEFRIATCQACRTRDCCSHFRVDLTGRDILRIAKTLQIAPSSFVGIFHADDPEASTSFALSHGDERYVLALKRLKRPGAKRPCSFLLKLNTGRRLCALGALRPAACQVFPATSIPGLGATVLGVYNGPGCWRSWHLGEIDQHRDRLRIEQRNRELVEYCEIVAKWNAQIASSAPDIQVGFDSYMTFLVNAYAHLPEGAPVFTAEV